MKSLVINLDRNPQRLKRMEKIFADLGLSFERVQAVDGKQLTDEQINKFCPSQEFSAGEIGCFLSHRKCWETIANGQDDYVAVFEDDVHLSNSAKELLKDTDWIPEDAGIVKIETNTDRIRINKNHTPIADNIKLAKLESTHLASGGYIISREIADELLTQTSTMKVEIDQLLFNPKHKIIDNLIIYQLIPAICIQDIFVLQNAQQGKNDSYLLSDITKQRKETRKEQKRKKYSTTGRLKKELLRPARQFYNFICRICTNVFTDSEYVKIKFNK